jgi:hypothetical protein
VVFRDTALEWFCYGAGESHEKRQRRSRCRSFQYGGEATVYDIRRLKKKYDGGDVVNTAVKNFFCRQWKLDIYGNTEAKKLTTAKTF